MVNDDPFLYCTPESETDHEPDPDHLQVCKYCAHRGDEMEPWGTCDRCLCSVCEDCFDLKFTEIENECGHTRRCFCPYFQGRYCADCVTPEDINILARRRARDEEEEERATLIAREKPLRILQLKNALTKHCLELREDSRLCKKYIETGEGDLDFIVQRMSEMKWLFEYQDMRTMLQVVQNENMEELEAGYIPDVPVFPEAERRILQEHPYPQHPYEWPWVREKAARTIQKHLQDWIWRPISADGKIGISARVGMRACGISFPSNFKPSEEPIPTTVGLGLSAGLRQRSESHIDC